MVRIERMSKVCAFGVGVAGSCAVERNRWCASARNVVCPASVAIWPTAPEITSCRTKTKTVKARWFVHSVKVRVTSTLAPFHRRGDAAPRSKGKAIRTTIGRTRLPVPRRKR
jgi:hypothetical protein